MGRDLERLRRIAVVALVAAGTAVGAAPAVAAPHSDRPEPTTGCAALGQGSSGKAVATVQRAVAASPDGDFGPATAKAVRKWQRRHEVTVSGVIDAATWSALPPGVAAKACGRHVAGSGVTASCAVLRRGDHGVAVEVLQRALHVSVDGQFGPATQHALTAAQTAHKVAASGATNRATWRALGRTGTPACTGGSPAASGDATAQARISARVQRMAATLANVPGTTTNRVARLAIHFARHQVGKPYQFGAVGPKAYDCSGLTMTAYQHSGLTIPRVAADQYAGGGTAFPLDQAKAGDLLFYASDLTKPSTVFHVVMYVGHDRVLDAPHTGAFVGSRPLWTTDLLPTAIRPVASLHLPLRAGTTGWSVAQLQQALNRHGAGLDVDGGYGPATKAAVRSWQRGHGLTASGVVRVGTWLTLG